MTEEIITESDIIYNLEKINKDFLEIIKFLKLNPGYINTKILNLIDEINKDNLTLALSKIEKLNKKDSLKTAKENTIELMVKSHLKILR